jgi:hypothetical protein
MRVITKISIIRQTDLCPDLSYLGKYSSDYTRGAVDRKAVGDMRRDEYQYFIPANDSGIWDDYRRYEEYNNGQWTILYIYAEALIRLSNGSMTIRSNGIGGVESDGDYENIENEVLSDLKTILVEEGFGVKEIEDIEVKKVDK